MSRHYHRGFTIIELITVIAIIGTLATIVLMGYFEWQRSIARNIVQSDVQHAVSGLESYQNFKNSYPPNLAGTNFAASTGVALMLITNAPSVGVYENLSPDENAQLFLNACNANIFGTPNNTTCQAQGSGGAKIHVKGTASSNTIWPSPVQESQVTLPCGAACNQITQDIIAQFKAQGGVFPILISKSSTPLPEPTLQPNGNANKYCLEGRSANYASIVYHTTSNAPSDINIGPCANDPDLHYYP